METLYNKIGPGYNNTRAADTYLLSRIIALLQPESSGTYLDIGCGTGNYTIALTEKGFTFCGIDPSEEMLEVAKARKADINWLYGTAETIPASDNTFDGAIGTLTIHHWQNIGHGFSELYRVLKPGAKIVLLTATPEQMDGYWLNHYFPEMLRVSTIKMPSVETISELATAAGLKVVGTEKYFVQDTLQDYFLHVGKNRPELYFDEGIRKGISSFAAMANIEEVQTGLAALKADLKSGAFSGIKEKYENGQGDYLFVVLGKMIEVSSFG